MIGAGVVCAADPEPEADLAPAPPAEPRGPAHAVVEPTGQPGDAVVRVHVAVRVHTAELYPQMLPANPRETSSREIIFHHELVLCISMSIWLIG